VDYQCHEERLEVAHEWYGLSWPIAPQTIPSETRSASDGTQQLFFHGEALFKSIPSTAIVRERDYEQHPFWCTSYTLHLLDLRLEVPDLFHSKLRLVPWQALQGASLIASLKTIKSDVVVGFGEITESRGN
jgi:hypothetical protein